MKGAASRVSTLVIAVCAVTGTAFAQPPAATRAAARGRRDVGRHRPRSPVGRTSPARRPIVGHQHFWLELRGMKLKDDQAIEQDDRSAARSRARH